MNIAADAHARNPSPEEIFEGGWCHAPNGLFDHPYFIKEDRERPLSRREAVLWIAKHVRWTDNCTIRKGQGTWSLRYLAEAWRWTKDKVSRFLKQLEKLNIIRAVTATVGATAQCVITYLFSTCYVKQKDETATAARQNRDSTATNTKTEKDSKKKKDSCGGEPPRWGFPDVDEAIAEASSSPEPEAVKPSPSPSGSRARKSAAAPKSPDGELEAQFEQFWQTCPKRKGPQGAGKSKLFEKWKPLGAEKRAAALAGAELWARRVKSEGGATKYTPMIQTWFNQRRWESEVGPEERAERPKEKNWAEASA
jgi:hypothetical protein